ncbi:MAG: BamA/TamA family outer membrane protein [Rhizonema sp. NSF051]|nr:BamA/TamA family outer membrane protein [Rhizonema sp. NSF051]
MFLSPFLMTVVTIAAPLGGTLNVNAQTAKSSKNTLEVFIPTKNQVGTAEALRGLSAVGVSKEIAPTSTTQKTSQIFPTDTSPQTPLPTIPDTSPQVPTNQQQTPFPTQPSNQQQTPFPTQPSNQQQTPFPTQPSNQQQTPFPTQPSNQQQTPFPTQPSNQQQTNPNPPATQPEFPDNTQPNQEPAPSTADETRVLVSELSIRAEAGQLSPQLENEIYKVIRTQAGRTTTRSQLQEDINAIFATGFFSNVQATPEDTPLGVRVTFVVRPNPTLTKVQVQANPGTGVPSVLSPNDVDAIFRDQYGKILNLRDLQASIKQLVKRYQDQGYVLANVIGAPQVAENGVVTLQVAEGVVENIQIRFRNKQGQETNSQGKPIRGRTRSYVITRELQLKPGKVFNRNTVQKDLQRVYGLGLFEDVNVGLNPGTDPSKVDVLVNVVERNSGSIGAGAGVSSSTGLFGTISYQQQNLGGRNQKLAAEFQLGQRETLFDFRFTDPWIKGDPYRTSYTAEIFRRQSVSLIFEGKDHSIETVNPSDPSATGDRPRVVRLGGGVTFTRPLAKNPFESGQWVASAGLQYQKVTITDADGNLRRFGQVEGSEGQNRLLSLSESGTGRDDLLFLQFGVARDRRNNPLQPTKGSVVRFGLDQSAPIGQGSILLTRLRGSYSQYFPVNFTHFTKGPQAIAFNIQGGTILGDLPPYEAFSLGGSNSVRGYEEGGLSSGRSFVQASVEYRFPVFSVVSGALFFDFGSDLGTTDRTAQLLNKDGTGFGYGIGVRVNSPLGPIRIDYGLNNDGGSRINFGIGERF